MAQTKLKLLVRASRQLRDTEFSIYSKALLSAGLDDAVDRIIQIIPELSNMPYLVNDDDVVQYLPNQYSQLLWIMACSRAMEMDERNNEAARYRNEFEQILADLESAIADGSVVIIDPNTGLPVEFDYDYDYVRDEKNVYGNNTVIELEPGM